MEGRVSHYRLEMVLAIGYQDKFGLPDDQRTSHLMAELDWDGFAHNWEY